ncbi:MAG: hypothetical protein ACOVN0_07325 [Niveispirillum sp.]|uniref:hypothetical protein n=1 Tax=Niveispirillum sp. TaxID=1917217 RepID=UPI003BA8261C
MRPAIRHSALTGNVGLANFRGHDFDMHCVCCGEECRWRTDLLVRRHGHDWPVAAFSRGFVCHGCGEVGTSVLRIVERPADQQHTRFRRMAPRPVLGGGDVPSTPVHWRMRGLEEGAAA